jgi:hypothetical protein
VLIVSLLSLSCFASSSLPVVIPDGNSRDVTPNLKEQISARLNEDETLSRLVSFSSDLTQIIRKSRELQEKASLAVAVMQENEELKKKLQKFTEELNEAKEKILKLTEELAVTKSRAGNHLSIGIMTEETICTPRNRETVKEEELATESKKGLQFWESAPQFWETDDVLNHMCSFLDIKARVQFAITSSKNLEIVRQNFSGDENLQPSLTNQKIGYIMANRNALPFLGKNSLLRSVNKLCLDENDFTRNTLISFIKLLPQLKKVTITKNHSKKSGLVEFLDFLHGQGISEYAIVDKVGYSGHNNSRDYATLRRGGSTKDLQPIYDLTFLDHTLVTVKIDTGVGTSCECHLPSYLKIC